MIIYCYLMIFISFLSFFTKKNRQDYTSEAQFVIEIESYGSKQKSSLGDLEFRTFQEGESIVLPYKRLRDRYLLKEIPVNLEDVILYTKIRGEPYFTRCKSINARLLKKVTRCTIAIEYRKDSASCLSYDAYTVTTSFFQNEEEKYSHERFLYKGHLSKRLHHQLKDVYNKFKVSEFNDEVYLDSAKEDKLITYNVNIEGNPVASNLIRLGFYVKKEAVRYWLPTSFFGEKKINILVPNIADKKIFIAIRLGSKENSEYYTFSHFRNSARLLYITHINLSFTDITAETACGHKMYNLTLYFFKDDLYLGEGNCFLYEPKIDPLLLQQ